MAWRQQLQLLQRLSTASDISEFGKSQEAVHQLCLYMQEWSQGRKGRDCPDLDLFRAALAAGRNGLQALCLALKAKKRVAMETKACISWILGLVDNLLSNYVAGGLSGDLTAGLSAAAAAASGGMGLMGLSAGAPTTSVSEAQALMLQIGFLDPFTEIFSAVAATFNDFLQSKGSTVAKATAKQHSSKSIGKLKHQDATTLSATAPFPLIFVKRLLALWLRIRKLSAASGLFAALAGFGQTASQGMSLGPKYGATIQPVCSLLLVLMQYEHQMDIDLGPAMASLDGKHLIYGVVSQVMLTVPAMPKMSQLSWLRPDDASQRSKPAANDSMLQHPEVHALLLFTLAASVHGLHREQKGVSPATLLEPIASRSSDQARKQQKQQLKVQDSAMGVLQDLKVDKAQAQRFWKNYNQEGNHLPQPATLQHQFQVILEHLCSGFESHTKLPTSSSKLRSQLPVMLHHATMLLKLLVQLTALQPTPSEVHSNLSFVQTISAIGLTLHEAHGSDRKIASTIKAALSEVTDSILAPLVLQVGPAVLHALQQPDCSQKLQSDIRESWHKSLGVCLAVKIRHTGEPKSSFLQAVTTWSSALEQQPFTAVAAIDVAIRAMAAAADPASTYLALVFSDTVLNAVAKDDKQPVGAGAVSDVSNNSTRSRYTARPLGLFLSCAKLYSMIMQNNDQLAAQVYECTVSAVATAVKMDFATNSKNSHSLTLFSQRRITVGSLAASWLHAAARCMYCSSQAMLRLQPGASGVVEVSKLTRDPGALPIAICWTYEQAKQLQVPDKHTSAFSEILAQLQLDCEQLQQGFRSVKRPLMLQLQMYADTLAAVFPTLLCCNNPGCSNVSGLSELSCVGNSRCSRCKVAGYCSRECQAEHWSQHKKVCSLLR